MMSRFQIWFALGCGKKVKVVSRMKLWERRSVFFFSSRLSSRKFFFCFGRANICDYRQKRDHVKEKLFFIHSSRDAIRQSSETFISSFYFRMSVLTRAKVTFNEAVAQLAVHSNVALLQVAMMKSPPLD